MSNKTTLQSHNMRIQNLINTANSLPDAGSGGLDTSDATATASDILSGKTAYVNGSKVTGNIATVTQPTPTVSINSSGLITASYTPSKGYTSSTTSRSATKQLTTQAAQTITPGTSNKTISSGRYLTGTQTIKGDSNLVASNIKSGVSIFGVTGTYAGSGGSGGGVEVCTVSVIDEDWAMPSVRYITYDDDTFDFAYDTLMDGCDYFVVKNSYIHLEDSNALNGIGVTVTSNDGSTGSYYDQRLGFFYICGDVTIRIGDNSTDLGDGDE